MKQRLLIALSLSVLLVSCGQKVQNSTDSMPTSAHEDTSIETSAETSANAAVGTKINTDAKEEDSMMEDESSESAEHEKNEADKDKNIDPTVQVKTEVKTETKITPPAPEKTSAKTYTTTEVATHSTEKDCWLILSGKVYDVTKFIPSHPGGKAIIKGCGKDASAMFAGHPERAKTMKEQFYIGDLK